MNKTRHGIGAARRRLILASGSPRRKMLLEQAGYLFVIEPADIDESAFPRELAPGGVAQWLATRKAEIMADRFPEDVVLAADTVVALGKRMLGKPAHADDARQMLGSLSGTIHEVTTGVAVVCRAAALAAAARVTSTVQMRSLSAAEVEAYVASNQWMGKAGGYGIQDDDPFVTRMSGNLTNIVGLPMERTAQMLADAGIWPSR